MLILRQKEFTFYDAVNKKDAARSAFFLKKKMKFNRFLTDQKLKGIQRKVDRGKISQVDGSKFADEIMGSYYDKNRRMLDKSKMKVGKSLVSPGAAQVNSRLNTINNTTPNTNTNINTNNTQQNNNGQGVSVLQGLKNTWGGMTGTQKNIARVGAAGLAIGGAVAMTNAIKNRQRRKAEEEERRNGIRRGRGGVVVVS